MLLISQSHLASRRISLLFPEVLVVWYLPSFLCIIFSFRSLIFYCAGTIVQYFRYRYCMDTGRRLDYRHGTIKHRPQKQPYQNPRVSVSVSPFRARGTGTGTFDEATAVLETMNEATTDSAATTTTTYSSPCDNVRRTCTEYVETEACLKHVTIDRAAVQPLAAQIRASRTAAIQWDEEDWHYNQCPADWATPSIQKERVAGYILALDSINFCFWPHATGYEYVDLATTLTSTAQADHAQQEAAIAEGKTTVMPEYVFSALNLKSMTVQQMKELFVKHHASGMLVPPDMEKRCALWNEVGCVLMDQFEGSAGALIDAAAGSAPKLVQLLVDNFSGFQDTCAGLYFYKRAQICVGDWNAALKLNLRDMDHLTTFADYRVPQLLRQWKVLAAAVDAKQELVVGSGEEIAIRATTVAAVELLVAELSKNDVFCSSSSSSSSSAPTTNWNAVTTDWYLWQVGERMQAAGELKPHHRVRTIFY